jgi:hypothetical protein
MLDGKRGRRFDARCEAHPDEGEHHRIVTHHLYG